MLCNIDYTFKSLQATGVELNYISYKSKEVENAYEAISKLKESLAPNYNIRTVGDNKIWASYISQRSVPDYTLNLVTRMEHAEDADLYTHTVFYGNNKNPTNILYDPNTTFITSAGSYKAEATQSEFIYAGTVEGTGSTSTVVYPTITGNGFSDFIKQFLFDNGTIKYQQLPNGCHLFKTFISDAGKMVSENYTPIVYINGVPVDNKLHQEILQPVTIKTTQTTTTGGGK